MGEITQLNDAAKQDPTPLRTQMFREFKGAYTQATRTAIPDGYFFNIENAIPIGDENAHVVPNIGPLLFNYGSDTVYWSQSVNIGGTEYLVNFTVGGLVHLYNTVTQTSAQIGSGLSGAGSQCTQWKNSVILFIDATGYYSYASATFSKITGAGVPTAGDSLAVYGNRVWIVNGRILTFSAIDDYTATAFLAANGAGTVNITDSQIRGSIQRLVAQNGYLYQVANTAINAISDVLIPAGASPPTPQFSNNNIQALIGTDQPASLIAYDRNLMFASRYGVHNLYGVSAPKVSGDIDGTWQYLDFSQPISAGQVVVENILCAAFLIKRKNDPIFGSNTVLAMWFQSSDTSPQTGITETTDIWWFANFGAITFIVSAMVNDIPALFGFIGNKLYQLFADPTTAPNVQIMTKLWPMEDELARKECITAGVEAYFFQFGPQFTLSLDTENSSTVLPLMSNLGQGLWVNAAGFEGQWQNAALVQGPWLVPAVVLQPADAQGCYGRHVGMTLNTVGYSFELHHFALDYKLRDRWL